MNARHGLAENSLDSPLPVCSELLEAEVACKKTWLEDFVDILFDGYDKRSGECMAGNTWYLSVERGSISGTRLSSTGSIKHHD